MKSDLYISDIMSHLQNLAQVQALHCQHSLILLRKKRKLMPHHLKENRVSTLPQKCLEILCRDQRHRQLHLLRSQLQRNIRPPMIPKVISRGHKTLMT